MELHCHKTGLPTKLNIQYILGNVYNFLTEEPNLLAVGLQCFPQNGCVPLIVHLHAHTLAYITPQCVSTALLTLLVCFIKTPKKTHFGLFHP